MPRCIVAKCARPVCTSVPWQCVPYQHVPYQRVTRHIASPRSHPFGWPGSDRHERRQLKAGQIIRSPISWRPVAQKHFVAAITAEEHTAVLRGCFYHLVKEEIRGHPEGLILYG